jgi:hypothetical protein
MKRSGHFTAMMLAYGHHASPTSGTKCRRI